MGDASYSIVKERSDDHVASLKGSAEELHSRITEEVLTRDDPF